MKPKILGFDGKEIVLNSHEKRAAEINQRQVNALGFEIDMTTLTTIIKKVTEQKFFHIAPADYLPVRVGEGAWSTALTTYRSFQLGDDFEKGNINTGGQNGRLSAISTGIDSLSVPVMNWAKEIGYTLFDLQQAAKSGNWDLVTELEKGRKTNWDLGIQKIAFLGSDSNPNVLGLLTQAVTPNTSLITTPISQMAAGAFKTFCASILGAYRTQNNRTAFPTHFIIPEDDYLGLASPTDAGFPLKSALAVLLETFQVMTNNPNFKILPCAYGLASQNSLGVNRYALLNYDESSIRMDIPVDYTSTLANTVNSFSFQNVGYGQYTGVLAYRPLELMYLDDTP